MALIYWGQVEAASDQTMATITRTAGTAFRGALYDLIDAVLAGNPDVVEAAEQAAKAAVDAELAARDIAIHGQRGIHIEGAVDGYFSATLSPGRRLLEGLKRTGEKYLARILTPRPISWVGGGQAGYVKSDESLWVGAVSPRGRKLVWLDKTGRLRNPVIDQLVESGTDGGPFLVVPILGQSTATQAVAPWSPAAFSNSRVYTWSNGQIVQLSQSATYIGSGIARELARQNPGTRILLVPCGVGSSGFSTTSINPAPEGYNFLEGAGTWDRNLTEDPDNRVVRTVSQVSAALNGAISQNPGSRLIGFVWHQGQSDRTRHATYADKLDDLIAYLRGLWGATLPVAIGGLIEEWAADPGQVADGIMRVLRDTPRRVDFCTYEAAPVGSGDQVQNVIHAAPPWAEEHGKRLAGALLRARLAAPTAPPALVGPPRITRSGTEAIISWDAAPTRVTGYELDYSTNSGGSWQAATISEPVRTDLTLAEITATAPVWVRMRVLTPAGISADTLIAKG